MTTSATRTTTATTTATTTTTTTTATDLPIVEDAHASVSAVGNARADAVEPELLRPLLAKRNAPGLLRFGFQVALLLGASTATASLAAAGNPLAFATAFLAGVGLVMFFPSLHEAGHGTAFRTPWLNGVVVAVSAAAMLQAPRFFREFHWEHHRFAQDPERDPEINGAPRVLDGWPTHPLVYLFIVCGQGLMIGKLAFTVGCAILPRKVFAQLFPFIPERAQNRVAWESRATLLFLGTACAAGQALVPGFAVVLLAWPIAHLLLGFYLMPEHTGLPHEGSQCERTRSVESNAIVRWMMWNMPLHAVHHAQPGVPFHAVPELHRLFEPRLTHISPGYFAFHGEAIRRLFGRR